MYERNGTEILNEIGPPRRLRPAKKEATECWQRCKEPTITANLSAGLLENNRMKRPKRAMNFLVAISGHGVLLALAILLPLYFSSTIDLHRMETTYLVAPPLQSWKLDASVRQGKSRLGTELFYSRGLI